MLTSIVVENARSKPLHSWKMSLAALGAAGIVLSSFSVARHFSWSLPSSCTVAAGSCYFMRELQGVASL